MRAIAMIILCLGVGLSAVAGHEEKGEAKADKAAIKATIMDYFHGQGTADRDRLRAAFKEDIATMTGMYRDDAGAVKFYRSTQMGETLDRWAANDNPPGADREGEILSLEVVDGRIATVIFRYTDRFYDAFSLFKIDGEWKIVAKTFIPQADKSGA